MVFAIGRDDSPVAVLLAVSCMILFTPTCVFAFWHRKAASIGLSLIALAWVSSIILDYRYDNLASAGKALFADYPGLLVCWGVFLFFAAFGVIINRAKWPPLRDPKNRNEIHHA